MKQVIAICCGASLGALSRWGLSELNRHFPLLPPGTLVANLLGGYLIGLAIAYFAHADIAPHWRLFVVTGFLGALTTFSTFSVEVTSLLQQGRPLWAMFAVSSHVLGSLLMTALGLASWNLLHKAGLF
ncbi:fluoride efflux transporter CrcB [Craterilacuibacter sp. RT1T]|uniref:fluoride efflux transporter CrcB n=1 Tax=Craterilacuibacter sp. RT1T TaxID=2942211 RepID=UPI0020BE70EE|nr:fluoride efflux transporter CrcB [Craterilacuibacter sp. RT1T]MCL6263312.1 fluoride efflux transporter CrcB [Craterilacuibacter sp. RT1T]